MKKGWQTKKLGNLCEVIAGQSPEGKYYNNNAVGLPFYQGKKEFSDKFIGEAKTWTTEVTKESIQGDVLMSVRAPVGPINFATQRICIGRGLAAIRATELIDKEYLFNFLLKHESEIVGNAGAVFDSINKTQIENILVPLPPLPEQQRIVAILDEAFEGIATATVLSMRSTPLCVYQRTATTLSELPAKPLYLQESCHQASRWQRARDTAHDRHVILGCGWQAHFGAGIHG